MAAKGIRAGVAEVDITPPMGVEMVGYGPYEKRVCTEVLDPLYARALWLESEDRSALILTVDLCMVGAALHQAVLAELQGCGVDRSAVMICASHTHSEPATIRTIAWGELDAGYMAKLPGLLARAARQARQTAVPARIGAVRIPVSGVGVNREQSVAPTDTAAQLLRVDREDGSSLAAIFNFGAHGVVRYPFTSRISADWPGLVAAAIRHEMKGCMGLFLQGPCGNINGHIVAFDRNDPQTAQKVSDMRTGAVAMHFCEQILPALKELRTSPDSPIRSLWKTIDLPCVRPDRGELEAVVARNRALAESMTYEQLRPLHERLPGEAGKLGCWRAARYEVDRAETMLGLLDQPLIQQAPIQILQIGPATIVAWPAEVFVELGLELRQRSPHPLTFVASLANDGVGYIPTTAVHESKGKPNDFGLYPREITPFIWARLPYRRDVSQILVEETMAMLNSLHT